MKILIACFSRQEDNTVAGRIVDLSIGNTEAVAKKIQGVKGVDLFRFKLFVLMPQIIVNALKR